jgi:hypothetical protein
LRDELAGFVVGVPSYQTKSAKPTRRQKAKSPLSFAERAYAY